MKKIIAVDLDGTLLKSDGKASKTTINYLKKLKEDGHIILVATNRMLTSAISAINDTRFANYMICDGGSLIYNPSANDFIYKSAISKDLLNDICKYKDEFSYMVICTTDNIYKIYNEDECFKNKVIDTICNAKEIMHIIINLKNFENIEQIKNDLTKNIPELHFLIMQDSFCEDKWLDVFNIGNSKFNSISKIADIENISNDDIICFGDGLNDIEMIQKCGIGVAMANALDEVKQVADFITESNDKNGIITFLKNNL